MSLSASSGTQPPALPPSGDQCQKLADYMPYLCQRAQQPPGYLPHHNQGLQSQAKDSVTRWPSRAYKIPPLLRAPVTPIACGEICSSPNRPYDSPRSNFFPPGSWPGVLLTDPLLIFQEPQFPSLPIHSPLARALWSLSAHLCYHLFGDKAVYTWKMEVIPFQEYIFALPLVLHNRCSGLFTKLSLNPEGF